MINKPTNNANKDKKVVIVAEINEKVAKAKAIVFTNYAGLTNKQIEQLKKDIKKSDAEFMVAKNTLMKRSLTEKGINIESEILDGQTGTMFLYNDIVAPLKALAKMIKALEKPQIRFGVLDGKTLSGKDVLKLSTLPSREQLLGQLVGVLKSPIFGLHRALNWNIQKFVMTLSAIKAKKA